MTRGMNTAITNIGSLPRSVATSANDTAAAATRDNASAIPVRRMLAAMDGHSGSASSRSGRPVRSAHRAVRR